VSFEADIVTDLSTFLGVFMGIEQLSETSV